ncbi:nucleotidyltransferase family protein [Halotia branconii]|uniref:Nucleotidyltransferase domain-containing protein n=1 Tax=Halotia branconii CENA392 TaxID=1539056 RepID=A0AAJ6NRC2_9CYAN|nr:nucleotidyltransferase domain-containing protein [Halotia branconii]WGV25148.1 nucleotidyltransferase domain-containing protein [Halotia branconii CENA392]
MAENKKVGLKQLLQEKREEIINIATKHGAYNLRVFGSVARGEETEASDIDFLIDYDLDKISPWFPGGLILDLENLLNRKVDIVTTKSLHDLKNSIACIFPHLGSLKS